MKMTTPTLLLFIAVSAGAAMAQQYDRYGNRGGNPNLANDIRYGSGDSRDSNNDQRYGNYNQRPGSMNVADQGLQCWQYDEIKGETRGYSKLKCNGECCAKVNRN
jgi:hypothetical protein